MIKTIEKFNNGELKNIIGFIGKEKSDKFTEEYMFFTYNQLDEIRNFIIKRFHDIFNKKCKYIVRKCNKSKCCRVFEKENEFCET